MKKIDLFLFGSNKLNVDFIWHRISTLAKSKQWVVQVILYTFTVIIFHFVNIKYLYVAFKDNILWLSDFYFNFHTYLPR